MQDRPEQNAGYDAAVRQGAPGTTRDDLNVEALPGDAADLAVHEIDEHDTLPAASADDRAEREAIAEVRRRERRR
ncbi:MAG: hypothetical protein IT184_14260 [Acidobacteria bacterium]|nr:hypothetical protein [Acidobacteriota bacterium]